MTRSNVIAGLTAVVLAWTVTTQAQNPGAPPANSAGSESPATTPAGPAATQSDPRPSGQNQPVQGNQRIAEPTTPPVPEPEAQNRSAAPNLLPDNAQDSIATEGAQPNAAPVDNRQLGNTGNQNPEQWRYRQHNGRWWYWTPGNSWVVWLDNRWQPYTSGMFSSNYAGTYYTPSYRTYGYSNPSYGYRYPSYGYSYPSGRYYSGYRGWNNYGNPYGYGPGGWGGYRGARGGVSVGPGGVGFGFRF